MKCRPLRTVFFQILILRLEMEKTQEQQQSQRINIVSPNLLEDTIATIAKTYRKPHSCLSGP